MRAFFFARLFPLILCVPGAWLLSSGSPIPQQPQTKTGDIQEGKEYRSTGGRFSITVPATSNPFVRSYKWEESRLKYENYDYEEVVFLIQDFGQAYGAGVRRIPQGVLVEMAKEEPKETLSKLAFKALDQWRDLAEEPEVVEDTPVETQFGEGLLRVYLAKKSSLMGRVVGTDEGGKPKIERFDTHIAVLVAKKGDWFFYATAEDDYLQTNATAPPAGPFDPKPTLKKALQSFFASLTVKL